jgi:hypothetical protein
MPSRLVTLAIVAFWLATTGWFVAREVAPRWRAGQAPPYVIEFADEALRNAPNVHWRLSRNGQDLGIIRTGFKYREADDAFLLTAEGARITLLRVGPVEATAEGVHSDLLVTREGELRATQFAAKLNLQGLTMSVAVNAEVRGDRIERSCVIDSPLGRARSDLRPVPSARGSVLTPLHPVNRIQGLRPGQRWRVPLLDPLGDAARAAVLAAAAQLLGQKPPEALPDAAPSFLDAEVRPAPEPLAYQGADHDCLLIEYRGGEDFTARTWVRAADGLVLRQEARTPDEELVLQRE